MTSKISKRQKGNLFQDWCEKWIKKNYPKAAVHNQKTVAKLIKTKDEKTGELKEFWISKRNDIFGCIDLIVILPSRRPIYVQATIDTHVTKRQKELEKVPWDFRFCNIELWQKKKPGEIHIKMLSEEGFSDHGKIIRGRFYKLEE